MGVTLAAQDSVPTMTALVTSADEELFWVGAPQVIRCLCMTITGLLCVVFNSLNFVVLKRAPHSFGETTSTILLSMAVTDIGAGFSIIVIDNIENFSDIPLDHPFFCSVAFPLKAFSVLFSLSLLVVLNLDRVILVKRPLRYFILVTRNRIFVAIAIASVIPIGFAIYNSTTTFKQRNRYCVVRPVEGVSSLGAIAAFIAVFIIAGVLFITYVNITLLYTACRHSSKMRTSVSPSRAVDDATSRTSMDGLGDLANVETPDMEAVLAKKNGQREKRSVDLKGLRTVLTVTATLYVAVSPFIVRMALVVAHDNYVSNPWFEFFGYFGGYSNSWLNPITYLLFNSSYRNSAKRMFRRL